MRKKYHIYKLNIIFINYCFHCLSFSRVFNSVYFSQVNVSAHSRCHLLENYFFIIKSLIQFYFETSLVNIRSCGIYYYLFC